MPTLEIRGVIVSNDDGWIYDWFGMDNTCPKKVKKALQEANGEPVTVDLSSPGGEISAGSDIYTMLRSYDGGVKIRITGSAHSAASVIAMAGESEMSPTAMMMIHNVSTYGISGDHNVMEHEAEVLRNATRAMAQAYVAKTGLSEQELLEMMDKETWMTAEEAVEHGFVDRIMFSEETEENEKKQTVSNGFRMAAAYNAGLLPESVLMKVRENKQQETMMNEAQAKFRLLSLEKI